MAKVANIQDRQSILDVAIEHTGGLEMCFDIALSNDKSLTDDLTVHSELVIPHVDNAITTHYTDNAIVPATGITNQEVVNLFTGEGIEYWGIEYDLIVS